MCHWGRSFSPGGGICVVPLGDRPILDVLLGEAMWADMLAASIAFQARRAAPIEIAATPRSSAIVVPFERTTQKSRMPVLAAFDSMRSNGADAYEPRRKNHAVA